jgi:tetratricopeptide (TPR) repeat protein
LNLVNIERAQSDELHCHFAADCSDPMLRKIVRFRNGQLIREATLAATQGKKTIKAFCIGLLWAKFRSLDGSLGSAWSHLALRAQRGTWAATLVENLGEDKDPAWWRYLRNELDAGKGCPFRLSKVDGRKRSRKRGSGKQVPTALAFNVSYIPESLDAEGLWSIGRLVLFLGETEKIERDGMLDLARDFEKGWKYRLCTVRPVSALARMPDPVSRLQVAPSRLFRGRNKGPELLVGRDKELAKLDAAWRGTGKKNILTIVAWAGVGKTSLVVHWKNKLLRRPDHGGIERYFDWSFYSQGTRREGDATGAATAASADLFLKEALDFFGDAELAASNAGAKRKGERLAELVAQQRTLLILDGLEPLQDARTGELRDAGLAALLRGLATYNQGLCIVTSRQRLPELATWRQTSAPEWKLAHLTDEAGASLLTKLAVDGTDQAKRALSNKVKGHALTLTLLGGYLKLCHHGDIRRVDRVDFRQVNERIQGGHAFRVIAAYERWFEENAGQAELAILRMLGLFDRPATPDCLAALCEPPIPGLTDALASLSEDEWNEAVTHLVELNLIEEQPWNPRRIVGFSEEDARKKAADWNYRLGEPMPFENDRAQIANRNCLDSHPLIREFFAAQLREAAPSAWEGANSRLFDHLRTSSPYWPEGLNGLQPLYEAVVHGCQAGRFQQSLDTVFIPRIRRGTWHYSLFMGFLSSDLAALQSYFERRWSRLVPDLSMAARAYVLNEVGSALRVLGRLDEALEPIRSALDLTISAKQWKEAAGIYNNLVNVYILLGDLSGAEQLARSGMEAADQSCDPFSSIASRANLAQVLHYTGRNPQEAAGLIDQADTIWKKNDGPFYYGLQWFRFCDLLVDLGRVEEAEKRAKSAYRMMKDIARARELALIRLLLGQISLRHSIETSSGLHLNSARVHIEAAIEGLRKSNRLDELPRALLARAWLKVRSGETEEARADLSEAQQLAERGPMRLHLADIHLHSALLLFDKEELKKARALIELCGYWRRKIELEDAEAEAKSW